MSSSVCELFGVKEEEREWGGGGREETIRVNLMHGDKWKREPNMSSATFQVEASNGGGGGRALTL